MDKHGNVMVFITHNTDFGDAFVPSAPSDTNLDGQVIRSAKSWTDVALPNPVYVGDTISRPRTNTCSARVPNSKGSPLQTTTFATRPGRSEP